MNPFPPLSCFGTGEGTVDSFVLYHPHSSTDPHLPNAFGSAVCPVPAVPQFSGFSVTQAVSDVICLHSALKGTSQRHMIPTVAVSLPAPTCSLILPRTK